VRLSRRSPAVALIVLATLVVSSRAYAQSPFRGTSLWVDEATSTQALAGQAGEARAGTLIVKAAEGTTPEPQFTAALVEQLHGQGLTVCAWVFVYGLDPQGEAQAALAAVKAGASCLVVDAEGQYDKRYGAAQAYVKALRSRLGGAFPIALAGQAEVLEHPTFPYSVFLGPGGFAVDMPQDYWRELGLSVPGSLRATLGVNALYGRAIDPVGQLFDGAAPSELQAFSSLAARYGCSGSSFFDADVAEPAQLSALVPARGARMRVTVPTIRPGADGDEIVWAQELLNAAGARLPVGGFFGATTAAALASFQRRHRLPADGLLTGASWRALLRYRAREPSWAVAPPDSAA
jgi:hypothetical protein